LDSAVQLATGGTYLFFLAYLFAFDVVSYSLRRVHPWIIAGAALAISAVAPSRFPSVPERFTERFTERFWYLLAMFTLGRCAYRRPQLWRRLQHSKATLVTATCASVAGALVATKGVRVSYRWEWAWSPALAMVLFARAAQTIEDVSGSRALRFVGQNSIVFYTAHFPVAYGVIRRSKSRCGRSGWRDVATAAVVSLAASTALAWSRRRSAVAERLFSA